jgi:hypothetical protein
MINTSLSKGFIYCSVVLFIISIFSSNDTSFQSLVVAYFTLACGITLLTLPILNDALKSISSINIEAIKTLTETIGPFILWLGVIGCLLALSIIYHSQISKGRVSTNYTNYTNLSSLLFLFSIWIATTKTEQDGTLPKKYNYISLLANVLNAICVIILYVILTVQTTDG